MLKNNNAPRADDASPRANKRQMNKSKKRNVGYEWVCSNEPYQYYKKEDPVLILRQDERKMEKHYRRKKECEFDLLRAPKVNEGTTKRNRKQGP
jgi:hypothetical protein